jgi:hypothetical protein
MKIDFSSTFIHQQQLQLHNKHAHSQQQNEQLLTQLLVALVMQQLEGALKGAGGPNGNGNGIGNQPVGGAGGGSGVGGAQQANGANGGQGIMGILTQFMELLKLLEKLFGDAAGKGANDMAQKLADALGLPGPDGQGGGGGGGIGGGAGGGAAVAGPDAGGGVGGAGGVGGPVNTGGSAGTGNAGGTNGTNGTSGTGHTANTNGTNGTASPASSGAPDAPARTGQSAGTGGTSGPSGITEPSGEKIVNETIVVKAGEVFDGKNMHFKAGAALGDGGRSEGQKPVFMLEDGATLKNVQISGADGVHVYGDATLQNVWWRDVGEDAMTKKAAGDIKVIGGGANDAHDKVFQLLAGGSLSIDGFTATNFGRLAAIDHRYLPARNDGTFPLEVNISNSKLTNGDEVFRTDAANTRITFKNNEMNNVNYDARGPQGMEVIGGTKVGRVEGNVI